MARGGRRHKRRRGDEGGGGGAHKRKLSFKKALARNPDFIPIMCRDDVTTSLVLRAREDER